MKLLVTGGGFVGKAIARQYPSMDITFMSRSKKEGNWIKGEVTGFRFPDIEFTHIIHAPLLQGPFMHHEAAGFRRVQEFARKIGAKLLYVSSGAAQGDSVYGHYKLQTEKLAEFDKIARLYAFVGPDLQQDAHYAIMNFIRDAMTTGVITVKGDGTNVRSWMWQGDMARNLMEILENGKMGYPYDVGSFESMSVKRIADIVAEMTHSTVTVIGDRQGNMNYVPDYHRMCPAALPYVPLRAAIRKTIDLLKP